MDLHVLILLMPKTTFEAEQVTKQQTTTNIKLYIYSTDIKRQLFSYQPILIMIYQKLTRLSVSLLYYYLLYK